MLLLSSKIWKDINKIILCKQFLKSIYSILFSLTFVILYVYSDSCKTRTTFDGPSFQTTCLETGEWSQKPPTCWGKIVCSMSTR